jgi:AcrR family transcriptional regulator
LPREVVAQAQRERMMDAMISAVADQGYPRTSVGDVISRAAVSRSTFYEQFKDKEDCFLASYDAIVRLLLGYVQAAYERPGAWRERVHAGLGAFLEALAHEPDAARVAFVAVIAAGPRAHQKYLKAIDAFLPFFEEGRSQVPHGRELPAGVPRMVVNGVAGIIFEEVVAGTTEDLPRLVPDLLYSALAPYLGHEAALRAARAARRNRCASFGARGLKRPEHARH